jgi:arginase
LVRTLRAAADTGKAVGISVTIFNPELDRNGSIATAFVHALELGLRRETQL